MSINLPLLLVLAVAICGVLALLDLLWFAPRRRKAIAAYRAQVAEADDEVVERLAREPVAVEYGKSFFPVLAIVLVLRSFLVEPFQIPSGSMRPTLFEGDFILVNKFAYGIRLPVIDLKVIDIGEPQRGDVMVFRFPSQPEINYIKRVVGVPGDRIRYSADKRLYVNGRLAAEDFIEEEAGSVGTARLYREQLGEIEHMIRKEIGRNRQPDSEWLVPEDHYFMLGDNRDNSKDSRFWEDPPGTPAAYKGMVPDRNIVGKAFAVWLSWPAPKMSNLPHFSRVGLIR